MRKYIPFILVLIPALSFAQFFRGFGVMGGLTLGKQKWIMTYVDSTGENTTTDKTKHKFLWGFNGELFAEFGNSDVVRWRTEFEYDRKGTKHRDTKEKNKLDYISWNNFLILRGELYAGYPYFLIGPRIEYRFRQNTPSVPETFKPFHASWSAGAGFELITYGPIKPLIELHYNPDGDHAMVKKYDVGTMEKWAIRNRAWELRLGIVIRINNNSCPPVFK